MPAPLSQLDTVKRSHIPGTGRVKKHLGYSMENMKFWVLNVWFHCEKGVSIYRRKTQSQPYNANPNSGRPVWKLSGNKPAFLFSQIVLTLYNSSVFFSFPALIAYNTLVYGPRMCNCRNRAYPPDKCIHVFGGTKVIISLGFFSPIS